MSNSGIELEGLAIAVQVFAGPRLLMSEKSYVEDNNPSITRGPRDKMPLGRWVDGSSSVTGALMLHPNAARALLIKRDGAMTR
jgi:hypothetical protein